METPGRTLSLILAALAAVAGMGARHPQSGGLQEAAELRAKAGAVAGRIAELAGGGKLKLDDETVRLMRQLVDELASLNERLNRLETELAALKRPEQGKPERSFAAGGYVQAQFRHSEEPGSEASAFEVRRAEVGLDFRLDEATKFRVSMDAASGASRSEVQLRDAWVSHSPAPGLELRAGQMRWPLGYDTVRPGAEREMPEPARYTSVLHGGDRGRGATAKWSVSDGWSASVGVWDALSAYDPEQAVRAPGAGGKLAWTAGLRKTFARGEAGVSGLFGARPGFVDSAGGFYPREERRFLYLDARYSPVERLTLRFEGMLGRDRVPVRSAAPGRRAADVAGWQAQADWVLGASDVVTVRYDAFDPGGPEFSSFGLAYSHMFAPGAKLVVALERYDDPARPRLYEVVTVRTQFRF